MENYKGIFEIFVEKNFTTLVERSEEYLNDVKENGEQWHRSRSRYLIGNVTINGGLLYYKGDVLTSEEMFSYEGFSRIRLSGDAAWVEEVKGTHWIGDGCFEKRVIKKWFTSNIEINTLLIRAYLKRDVGLINEITSTYKLSLLSGKDVKKVVL